MFDRVTCVEGMSEAMANALIESYRLRHVRVARAEGGWVLREDAPSTLPAPPTWADLP